MPVTSTSLSVGVERARTRSLGHISSILSWMMQRSGFSAFWSDKTRARNCSPVIAFSSPEASLIGSSIPAFLEIAFAVLRLSPVTMRTTMPACLQTWMEWGTSSLRGSSIPTMCTSVSSDSRFGSSSSSPDAGDASKSLYATAIVRRPSSAKAVMAASTLLFISSPTACTFPSVSRYSVHSAITISEAPLQYKRHRPSAVLTRVLMRLRLLENEIELSFGWSARIFLYGIDGSPGSPENAPSALTNLSIAHSVGFPE
mmetsp:Transcript_39162/g.92555  ORF Transcript_39162/g.92555 Transcript_39162/m.92555 type:complete len:257 (+) Transcript_39162:268-1038(+)